MKLKLLFEKLYSYCAHCLCAQYFVLQGGVWRCEECHQPLQMARQA